MIKQDLGIKEPEPRKPDKPNNPDSPKPNNPNPPAPTPPSPNPTPNPDNPNPSPSPSPSPSPNPNPTPEPEKWEDIKASRIEETKQEIDKVKDGDFTSSPLSEVKEEELQKDWEKELEKAQSETEFNQIKQAALKDIAEIKIDSPKERLKLKEHFILQLSPWEISLLVWPDGTWNARGMKDYLANDLNQIIKGNKNSTWERKHIIFTGDFKINSKDEGKKFDNRIAQGHRREWVVIKKSHNQKQYHTERNSFFLRKGEPDYHEFNSRKEAIDFLRQNDSYFKS